jgi:hypothetical protein
MITCPVCFEPSAERAERRPAYRRSEIILFSRNAVNGLLSAAGLRTVAIKPHWKSLTLAYVWEMGWYWQFRVDAVINLPNPDQQTPVRIDVGEMLIVAAKA